MGYIKEPNGIDFAIKGKPLTNKQKQAISEFIKADKEKHKGSELHRKANVQSKPKNPA